MTTHGLRRSTRPYRQRRPLPALLLIAALGALGLIVWLKVAEQATNVDEAVACDPPASSPPGQIYNRVGYHYLDDTEPAPTGKVKVTVLNSSGTRGQASLIRDRLVQLGFGAKRESGLPKPANDPAYEKRYAECRGQIRFGENGERVARSLSIAVDCVELIRDSRKDSSVDLAVGSELSMIQPNDEATAVLKQLKRQKTPRLDDELLANSRSESC